MQKGMLYQGSRYRWEPCVESKLRENQKIGFRHDKPKPKIKDQHYLQNNRIKKY